MVAVISAPFGEASLGPYRFYLLSLQNKIGDAVYLNARDDTDALVKCVNARSGVPYFAVNQEAR